MFFITFLDLLFLWEYYQLIIILFNFCCWWLYLSIYNIVQITRIHVFQYNQRNVRTWFRQSQIIVKVFSELRMSATLMLMMVIPSFYFQVFPAGRNVMKIRIGVISFSILRFLVYLVKLLNVLCVHACIFISQCVHQNISWIPHIGILMISIWSCMLWY